MNYRCRSRFSFHFLEPPALEIFWQVVFQSRPARKLAPGSQKFLLLFAVCFEFFPWNCFRRGPRAPSPSVQMQLRSQRGQARMYRDWRSLMLGAGDNCSVKSMPLVNLGLAGMGASRYLAEFKTLTCKSESESPATDKSSPWIAPALLSFR